MIESLSTRFLARLIVDLSNLLPRLFAEKNSPKDYLNALIRTGTRVEVNEIHYIFLSLRASVIKNNRVYSNNIKE